MDTLPFDGPGWREWRRMQAWRLAQLGWTQRDIAAALGVSEGAVSRRLAAARHDGPAALLARRVAGHPANLATAQRRLLPNFPTHAPEAYGFRREVWTVAPVARV